MYHTILFIYYVVLYYFMLVDLVATGVRKRHPVDGASAAVGREAHHGNRDPVSGERVMRAQTPLAGKRTPLTGTS